MSKKALNIESVIANQKPRDNGVPYQGIQDETMAAVQALEDNQAGVTIISDPAQEREIAELKEDKSALLKENNQLVSQVEEYQTGARIEAYGFELTSQGLVVPGEIDLDIWKKVGDVIFRIQESIQLLIGDFLNGIDQQHGVTYAQIAVQTGRSEKTLRNYKYVTGKVDMSLRKDNLTYGHYNIVAPVEDEALKRELLEAASKGDGVPYKTPWTISRLRREVKSLTQEPTQEKATNTYFDRQTQSDIESTDRMLEKATKAEHRNRVRKFFEERARRSTDAIKKIDEMG